MKPGYDRQNKPITNIPQSRVFDLSSCFFFLQSRCRCRRRWRRRLRLRRRRLFRRPRVSSFSAADGGDGGDLLDSCAVLLVAGQLLMRARNQTDCFRVK